MNVPVTGQTVVKDGAAVNPSYPPADATAGRLVPPQPPRATAGTPAAGTPAGAGPDVVPARGPLVRSQSQRLIAGVAGGIAAQLRLPPTTVRITLLLLTLLFFGLGAVVYVACWLFVPAESVPELEPVPRRDAGQFIAYATLAVGLALIAFGGGWFGHLGMLVPLLIVGVGAAVLWQRAGPARRRQWAERLPSRITERRWFQPVISGGRRFQLTARIVAGALLVAIGLIGLVAFTGGLTAWRDRIVFGSVLLVGLAVVMAPLLWRMFSELRAERAERIRSQTRADVAAMIHDHVLHTLALIQRNAHDDREVSRLARGQERELRAWLYQGTASPSERLKAALEAAAAEVEDTYAIKVDAIIVGDRSVDEHLFALVAAAREAMVNAAKHAKVSTVSLYAEVEPDADTGMDLVSVYVRDRGVGFDPTQVADDRHGVSGSIVDRMERHGGTAALRTAPDAGTEVRLTMKIASSAEG